MCTWRGGAFQNLDAEEAAGALTGNSRVPSRRASVRRAASGLVSGWTSTSFLLSMYTAFQINFLMFVVNLELN